MKTISALEEYIKKELSVAMEANLFLAEHPEISGEEYESSAFLVKLLEEQGVPTVYPAFGQDTAFLGHVLVADDPTYRVAVMAEYDALPDIGHGCGHSANGAISVLAALALRDWAQAHPEASKGLVVDLIGTPDEELRGGKVSMAKEGAFDGYDLAIMVHVTDELSSGNERFLALNDYRVKFYGQTAHAAGEPWLGRNAMNGAMLALHAIDMLRQHVRPETRIGSYIVEAGSASNVIPDYAEIEVCVRHTERAYLNELIGRVMKCIEGAAMATETTFAVEEWGNAYDDMKWNETANEVAESVIAELGLPFTPGDKILAKGSSDVGTVSYACPALHMQVQLEGVGGAAHTVERAQKMVEPEIALTLQKGAYMIGGTVLKLLADPALQQAVKEGFLK